MTIKIEPKTEKYLIDSIKRFFAEELDDDIGDLKAMRVLDFCVKEIGPSIYNQANAMSLSSTSGRRNRILRRDARGHGRIAVPSNMLSLPPVPLG